MIHTNVSVDLAHFEGQRQARRALEIAAAGGHHVLLFGGSGSPTALLAHALPDLLPPLTHSEAHDVANIHALAGGTRAMRGDAARRPPCRVPHQSIGADDLLGRAYGEDISFGIRPGEVSLAHHGVLLLEDLPKYSRSALASLANTLLRGEVTFRVPGAAAILPARPLVVGTMGNCPCGPEGSGAAGCGCSFAAIRTYREQTALLGRFDLRVPVHSTLTRANADEQPESSAVVAARVVGARRVQEQRFRADLVHAPTNGRLSGPEVDRVTPLSIPARRTLLRAGLSVFGEDRALRVARTIADLASTVEVTEIHMAEAVELSSLWHGIDRERLTRQETDIIC